MSESLRRELRQKRPFTSRAEEVLLELQRTANVLEQEVLHFLRRWDLTSTQYNVLRILRGARPDDLPCRDIGERMVTAVPDVTRLLDRLESRGLVLRGRDPQDRRVVRVGITDQGLEILASIDAPLTTFLERLLGSLGEEQGREMVALLESIRCGVVSGEPP